MADSPLPPTTDKNNPLNPFHAEQLTKKGAASSQHTSGEQAGVFPAGTTDEDRVCWVCGGATIYRHCKIVCQNCGFTRDCSDP